MNWFICSSAYELIRIEKPQTGAAAKDGKKDEKSEDKKTDTPEDKEK